MDNVIGNQFNDLNITRKVHYDLQDYELINRNKNAYKKNNYVEYQTTNDSKNRCIEEYNSSSAQVKTYSNGSIENKSPCPIDVKIDDGPKSNSDSVINITEEIYSEIEPCLDTNTNIEFENDRKNTPILDKYERIKQQWAYVSTTDESMAVEALHQLSGLNGNDLEKQYFSCPFCGLQFITSDHLDVHICTCVRNVSYCNFCQETFNTNNELSEHYRNYHLENIYICAVCSSVFVTKYEYKNHLNTHQTDNVHHCIICKTDFQRPSSLTNHMKIHKYTPGRAMVEVTKKIISVYNAPIDSICEQQQWFWNEKLDAANALDQNINQIDSSYGFPTSIDIPHIKSSIASTQETIFDSNFPKDCDSTCMVNSLNLINDNEVNIENHFENKQFSYNVPVKVENMSTVSKLIDTNSSVNQSSQDCNFINESDKRPHICSQCGTEISCTKVSHEKLHLDCDIFANEKSELDFRMKNSCKLIKESSYIDSRSVNTENQYDNISKLPLTVDNQISLNNTIDYLEYNNNCNSDAVHVTKIKIAKHACSKCDKKFATKQKMFRHMWIHRRKTFMCEVCGTAFAMRTELDEHRLAKHPADTPYVCQECGKYFASRQGLWEHGRVHGSSTSGLYNCKECNKTFASRQGFLIHTRTHTGERPYGCRYCWKAFRDGGTLRKHERIHTGERPHACPLCPRAFNQKVVLREHVRWVHAENKHKDNFSDIAFNCQLCEHSFNDREELCAHIVKHSDKIAALAKENAIKSNKYSTNSMTKLDQKPEKKKKGY